METDERNIFLNTLFWDFAVNPNSIIAKIPHCERRPSFCDASVRPTCYARRIEKRMKGAR
jgi:hypothetical protein